MARGGVRGRPRRPGLARPRLPVGRAVAALEGRIGAFGPWAPVVFALIYAAAVVAMVPGSAVTMAAGALFGPLVGTITASIGATSGAALAFLIARHLARGRVERALRGDPRLVALDRAIASGGWKVVALTRLSPVVPFNLQNYAYGLTGIGFWPYILTSWAAMLPGALLYASLGHAGRAGLEAAAAGGEGGGRARTPAEWALIGVGLVATVAATAFVARLARASFRRMAGADATRAERPDARTPATRSSPASGF